MLRIFSLPKRTVEYLVVLAFRVIFCCLTTIAQEVQSDARKASSARGTRPNLPELPRCQNKRKPAVRIAAGMAELHQATRQPASLPVVNLALPPDEVARDLAAALSSVGFTYAVGYGADAEVAAAFAALRAFFEQPLDEKMKSCSVNRALRGYSPFVSENFGSLAGERRQNDLVEKFRIGPTRPGAVSGPNGGGVVKNERSFYFENTWPAWGGGGEDATFQAALEGAYAAMAVLASRIARALAAAMGLPEAFFDTQMRAPTSILSANYFPVPGAATPAPAVTPVTVAAPVAAAPERRRGGGGGGGSVPSRSGEEGAPQMRIAPHTDVSLFTIVAEDRPGARPTSGEEEAPQGEGGTGTAPAAVGETGGLEVCIGGAWVAAPPLRGAVVINIGDCLSDWTGGRLRSTVHRVAPVAKSMSDGSGSGGRGNSGSNESEGSRNSSGSGETAWGCDRMSLAFFVTPDPATDVSPASFLEAAKREAEVAARTRRIAGAAAGVSSAQSPEEPPVSESPQPVPMPPTPPPAPPLLTYAQWRKARVKRAMSALKSANPGV